MRAPVEEHVAARHVITVESKHDEHPWRQFRPVCKCKRLRSKWQPTAEDAQGIGQSHLRREVQKEVKYRGKVEARRAG